MESPQKLRLFYRDPVAWNQPHAAPARAFYARVVALARNDSAFVAGAFGAAETSAPRDVIGYSRGDALVLVNVRPRAVSVTVTGFAVEGARDLLSGRGQRGGTVALPGYGAVVLRPSPGPHRN